jgi:hypothetical protein
VGYVTWPEEAKMSAHPAPRPRSRSYDDLPDLVEDLGLALMLFSGAAIVVTLLVLMFVL